jgi:tetratricopeptide (TPR) repeat protein
MSYAVDELKKAMELYKKAYGYNPLAISCMSTIGYCYEQLKDYKSALDWYEN